jgi:hypothetical protein
MTARSHLDHVVNRSGASRVLPADDTMHGGSNELDDRHERRCHDDASGVRRRVRQHAGHLNGQGSGGVWFAVDPDGTLIED